jgi:hypothetical protein
MYEPTARFGRIAILWRGDEAARRSVSPETSRFKAVFAALADAGLDAEMVDEDDVVDTVRAQLATFDGVLVWVNPIHEGRNRANLDTLLREVAARGVWVSAHPDVILKMGTKVGAPSHPHNELGLRHGPLSNGRGHASGIAVTARLWPARDQAQPRQRGAGRLEGRASGKSTQPVDGTRA